MTASHGLPIRLLTLCLSLALTASFPQSTTHSRIAFVGREPAPRNTVQGLLPSAIAPNAFDDQIEGIYKNVDASRSLLINDCDNFCGDTFFSYNRVVTQAAKVSGLADPASYPKRLYEQMKSIAGVDFHLRPYKDGADDQFQLLAIVNRMDLAQPVNADDWAGAELRFVYGAKKIAAKPDPEPFTVIIEFVLSDFSWKDFRALGSKWDALRNLQPSQVGDGLKNLLQLSWSPIAEANPASASLIRIRTNSRTGKSTGPWSFSQWNFAAGKGLSQVNLDDEINRLCSGRKGAERFDTSVCPLPKPQSCAAYRPMYNAIGPTAMAFKVSDPNLLVRTQCYSPIDPGMDGPQGVCPSDPAAAPGGLMFRARNILSLQQCSNCHGSETLNTTFTHISNRQEQAHSAALSRFLTGNGHPKPSLADLAQRNQNAGFSALLHVNWPGKSGCKAKILDETRFYNDLARRSLFLAAVLAGDPASVPAPELIAIIRNFATDMSH